MLVASIAACGDGGSKPVDGGTTADDSAVESDADGAVDMPDSGEADKPDASEPASPAEPSWGDVLIEDALSISGDATGLCYVDSAGKVLCRGLNDQGQLGNGSRGGVNGAPLVTTTDSEVLGIDDGLEVLALGPGARCALTRTGTVQCWGRVADTVSLEPITLELPEGMGEGRALRGVYRGAAVATMAVLTREDRLCVLSAAGTWQCSDVVPGAQTFAAIPSALYALDTAGSVSGCTMLDDAVTCAPLTLPGTVVDVLAFEVTQPTVLALLDDGHVACWGACPLDDASDLTFVPESAPELLPQLDQVARLVSPSCTVDHDDTLRCWGKPVRSGDSNFYTRPERVGVLPGLARVVGVDTAGLPNLALTSDGHVRAITWP